MPKDKTNVHVKKSAARLYAIQALFQMEVSKSSLSDITHEFLTHRIGARIGNNTYHEADLTMFQDLLSKVVKEQSTIDKLTNNSLKDSWRLNRIDPTLRAIFRAAIAELLIQKTPPKATINEFIEITKAFFPDGKEVKLVNGVLDNILTELKVK